VLTLNLALYFKPAFSGNKNLYLMGMDQGGLSLPWTQLGTWSSNGASPPVLLAFTPSSGSGTSQTFQIQVSDGDGASDINYLEPIFVTANGNNCVFYYSRAGNSIQVLNDAGAAWLPAVAIGGIATSENSYCGVSAAATSTVIAGNVLTLNLAVYFKAAFAGTKRIYLMGMDNGGLQLQWTAVGTWM
jgi:hypothetical protein